MSSPQELLSLRQNLPHPIGFVPTMGNLHQGHLSLLQRSRAENEISILSIYTNPTQFNNPADFAHYPKTLEQDIEIAKQAGVDYILLPQYQDLYPDNYTYQVSETQLSQQLEGEFRPGHFTGMLTVVLKLLLLVQAQRVYFGEKDYQQLELVRGMVRAFFINTEVVGCTIMRNEFGLPHSSRNSRLTVEQYQQARHFPVLFHSGLPCAEIKRQLIERGFKVEYIAEYQGRRFAAVKLGEVRLIDNILGVHP